MAKCCETGGREWEEEDGSGHWLHGKSFLSRFPSAQANTPQTAHQKKRHIHQYNTISSTAFERK